MYVMIFIWKFFGGQGGEHIHTNHAYINIIYIIHMEQYIVIIANDKMISSILAYHVILLLFAIYKNTKI